MKGSLSVIQQLRRGMLVQTYSKQGEPDRRSPPPGGDQRRVAVGVCLSWPVFEAGQSVKLFDPPPSYISTPDERRNSLSSAARWLVPTSSRSDCGCRSQLSPQLLARVIYSALCSRSHDNTLAANIFLLIRGRNECRGAQRVEVSGLKGARGICSLYLVPRPAASPLPYFLSLRLFLALRMLAPMALLR